MAMWQLLRRSSTPRSIGDVARRPSRAAIGAPRTIPIVDRPAPPGSARRDSLAERARLAQEIDETIVAPGPMTYGSQAAAATRSSNSSETSRCATGHPAARSGRRGPCPDRGRHLRHLPACGSRSPPNARGTAVGRHCIDCQRLVGQRPDDAHDGAPPLVGIDAIRAAAGRSRDRHSDPAGPVRAGPRHGIPEGGIPPADRRLQDPRRLRGGGVADRRPARPWRHHLLVRQPRPGGGPRRPAAGRAGGGRHAGGRAGHQVGAASPPTAPRSCGWARPATSASVSRSASPRSVAWPSSRPSTTTGSSPARAPSGSRSWRRCRTSRRSWSRSAAAGWPAASRRPFGRCDPGARLIGVEPELAADARDSLRGRADRRLAGDDVSRTIADGTRTTGDRRRTSPISGAARRHRHGLGGGDRGRRSAGGRGEPAGRRAVGALSVAALAFRSARPASSGSAEPIVAVVSAAATSTRTAIASTWRRPG